MLAYFDHTGCDECEVSYFHVIHHCLLTMLTMLRGKGEDLDGGGAGRM